MGRIGYFVKADNPADTTEDELLARDRLAHELMYFSRGNPVIYYGDEQGFTGTGGDQVARQTLFASQVPEYLDDDLLGTSNTHAVDNFVTGHPLYTKINELASLAKTHPALRNGAHQHRYSSAEAGIYAFSRLHRSNQVEYVVALNNSESEKTAAVPTYVANGAFEKVYGSGPESLTTNGARRLSLTVPALSTVVYKSVKPIAKSTKAPKITLNDPRVTPETNSRVQVSADVEGTSFNEVTFYAKVGNGDYKSIGTDDTRPYRVYHDVSSIPDGTDLSYRAVVRDNAGHTRLSERERGVVPKPELTIKLPAEGAGVFGDASRCGCWPIRSGRRTWSGSSGGRAPAARGPRSGPTTRRRSTPTTTTCPMFRWAPRSSTGPSSTSRTAPEWSVPCGRSTGWQPVPLVEPATVAG